MDWMILPLKRYAEFSGRSRRKEYWMFVLGYLLVFAVLGGIFGLMGAFSSNMAEIEAGAMHVSLLLAMIVLGILGLGNLIPSIAEQVRRFNDRNMIGRWLLGAYILSLVPVVGFIVSIALLVIFVLPGTPGPNRFGPDPKDPYGRVSDSDVFA